MSEVAYDGQVKIHWLPACASIAAPTVAEITAGVEWTNFVPRDGLSVPTNQNMVDTSDIGSVFDSQTVGTYGGAPIVVTLKRDDTDESDTYDTVVYGTAGFLLVARFGSVAATEICEVYPGKLHEPVLMQTAGNEAQKFTVSIAVTSAPNIRAVIAA